MNPPVALPTIEAILATRHKDLAFPEAVEKIFAARMRSYHNKVLLRSIAPTLIIYNGFLLADFLLLPQTFWLAVLLHLAVVTPAILLARFLYPRVERDWLREMVATAIPFLIVAQILTIYWHNRTAAADDYQYLAILVVIYANVNLRLGFRQAIVSTVVIAMAYIVTLVSASSSFSVTLIAIGLMTSTAYLSLIANLHMEIDQRFAFLTKYRDELLRQGAEEEAKRDALTGLANRRQLDEVSEALWSASDNSDEHVAIIMIDVDHFKRFNDYYGHMVGDTCLKRVAGAIIAELRSDRDLAIRFGGEEFLLLLPGTDHGVAFQVAERIRRRIEALAIPQEGLGARHVLTASFGVMAGPMSAHSLNELITAADGALYAAKRDGRNRVWPPLVRNEATVIELHPAGPAKQRIVSSMFSPRV